jgi:hypothetical protein
MDTGAHDLTALFSQLGLDNDEASIERFIDKHSPLPRGCLLQDADFWSTGQKQFLTEAVEDDAQWVDAVNHLDTLLRKA